MEDSKKIKIVYIAGFGRSGSTLLDLIISTSGRVFSIGEVYNFNDIMERDAPCACGESVSECRCWGPLHAQKKAIKISNRASVFNYLKVLNHLYNPLSRSKNLWEKSDDNYRMIRSIAGRFSSADAENNFILDSSKDVTRLIELVEDERFDVYCVHIVRDGRGTANSYASKRGQTSQNFYLALLKWLAANLLVGKFIKKEKIKSIRLSFECFCKNPENYIKELNNFLGIVIPDNYAEVIKNMDYHNIGGNRMSKKQRRKEFSGIYYDEKWKEEQGFLNKIISTVICYPFNKEWVFKSNPVKNE